MGGLEPHKLSFSHVGGGEGGVKVSTESAKRLLPLAINHGMEYSQSLPHIEYSQKPFVFWTLVMGIFHYGNWLCCPILRLVQAFS